jgi:glycosyltransferase involved in cell wall biosynthesis
MKILEISRSFYPSIGGLEKYISQRLKIYEKLNLEYSILTTDYTTGKLLSEYKNDKVKYLKQYTQYNFCPSYNKKILDKYDLISVNQIGNYLSDITLIHSIKLGKKVLLTPHFHFHTSKYQFLKSIHDIVLTRKLLNKVYKIICFTSFEVEYWQKYYRINANKLLKIPHYIEIENKLPYTEKSLNHKFILYLGRSSLNKRIDLLIKSINQNKNLPIDFLLTIKKSELSDDLQKLASNDERIKFLGCVSEDDKSRYLNNCEALIMPTDYEAFGIVTLEASLYCKPIICSGIGVLKEILDTNGVIYFENNIKSLSGAIKKFFTLDSFKKLEMGKVNYNNLSNYNFTKIFKSYEELFNGIQIDLK